MSNTEMDDRNLLLFISVIVLSCVISKMDLVMILDINKNVRGSNFTKVCDFVKGIVRKSDIDSGSVRVGLFSYGKQADSKWHLNEYNKTSDIMHAIDQLSDIDNYNYIKDALRTMHDMFTNSHGDRDDAPNFAIIITDALFNITVKTTDEIYQSYTSNIHKYAIGIGLPKTQVQKLNALASPPASNNSSNNSFALDSWDDLKGLEQTIFAPICPDCGTLSDPNTELSRTPDGDLQGTEVTLECPDGHKYTRVCKADGWSTAIDCDDNCAAIPQSDLDSRNAHVKDGANNGVISGTTVGLACIDHYEGCMYATCKDGSWMYEGTSCESSTTCSSTDLPIDVNSDGNNFDNAAQSPVGTTVTYNCTHGANAKTVCGEDGEWSAVSCSPGCEALVEANYLHWTFTTNEAMYSEEDTITWSCDATSENQVITCENGCWKGIPKFDSCPKDCGTLSDPNTELSRTPDGDLQGTEVTLECPDGHKYTRVCKADGWSTAIDCDDNCAAIPQSDLDSRNAHVKDGANNGVISGTTVGLACIDHYEGCMYATCKDGSWVYEGTSCESSTTCSSTDLPIDLNSDGNDFDNAAQSPVGTTVTYNCTHGANAKSVCGEDGEWSAVSCSPGCEALVEANYLHWTFTTNEAMYSEEDTITWSCDATSENQVITCENGCWKGIPKFDSCPKDCGTLSDPNTERSRTPDGDLQGTEVTLECPDGHNYTRVCKADGWSTAIDCDDMPTCEANRDSYGTPWNRTYGPLRVYLQHACPPDHTGMVYRQCTKDEIWMAPVYNCTADTLIRIKTMVQNELSVRSALKSLVSFTATKNAFSPTNLVGNVQTTSDILSLIVNGINSIELIEQDVVEDIFDVANTLMDLNATTAWGSIIAETGSGVDKVLTSIDSFVGEAVKAVKAGNYSGKNEEFAKSNFYVTIGRSKETLREISFPDRTSNNLPEWARRSVNSIVLPMDNHTENVSYSIVIYKDLRGMIPEMSNESESGEEELNSPVISLTLFKEDRFPLKKPATITFQLLDRGLNTPQCSYWNGGLTSWESDGCSLASYDVRSGVAVCECSHLTNFAVLMSHVAATETHMKILSVISIAGCGTSMICLVLTFAFYLHHWKRVGSDRAILLLNLCAVLFVAYLVFLTGVDRVANKDACTSVAVTLHFLYLSVFFIMLAKSAYVTKMLLLPMNRAPITKWCLLAAYGSAAVVVAVSMGITKLHGYGTDTTCWLSIHSGLLWAFVGPALFVMAANAVVVVIVLKIKFSTGAMAKKSNQEKISSGLRTILVLLPIMGLTWVFGVFSVNEDTVVFQYLFAVCNSLQGLLIFIFHCLLDHKMKQQLDKSARKTKRDAQPHALAYMKAVSATNMTQVVNLSSPSTSTLDAP